MRVTQGRHRGIQTIVIQAALIFVFAFAGTARATEMQQFVRETQRMSQVAQQMTMAWWLPQEFWQVSMSANANVTPEAREKVLAALEDYQIVLVLRAKTGAAGITDAQSKADMVSNARFEFNGKVVEPIPADKISSGAQIMLSSLKPVLAGMLGPLGQNMQLIIYPSKQDDKRLIDPTKPGLFQYTLYEQTFQWHLPLASLLPMKVDPKTNQEFPGDYEFNPYTGSKLSTK